jgi:hypothetical protein
MSEFTELQARLQEASASVETAKQRIFLGREKVRTLDLAKARVARGKGPRSGEYLSLERQQEDAQRGIASEKSRLDELVIDRDRLLEAFRPFADPRENLHLLPSTRPILLFPVRLETRFKVIAQRDGTVRHQLWVRIFPDDCSMDTFDAVLSASEITRARSYWTALWKAGTAGNDTVKAFVDERRRGAWRALMGLFNAGRAYWITTEYRPTNDADIPVRNNLSDRILVIPTDAPPDAATQDALEVYWEAVLRAAGDQTEIDAAFDTLTAVTGGDADAARALVATYVPQNIGEYTGEVPDDEDVRVVFLVFETTVDAKINAWSQAATVRTFPERFVLLGYQGNDAPPVINQLGAPVPNPLVLGPDSRDDIETLLIEEFGPEFADLSDEEKATKYVEYLAGRSETSWMFDFDQAVAMGLGFRVDLTAAQVRQGFTRLMMLGVRMGADHEAGRKSVEELLRNHQFGDAGFSLVAQGTPTNNTEDAESGRSVVEDADEAFDRYFGEDAQEDPTEPRLKRDGRRLAELLGIDPDAAALKTAENYFGRDQMEAEAMHTALWNATIGFYLESMLPPVVPRSVREQVRFHLVNHVKGRGAVPAIRIAKQPYGILPISNVRDLEWLSGRLPVPNETGEWFRFLRGLYAALKVMRGDWESLVSQVANVGKSGDAHAILLQALGRHAGSVEFDRRIAQSFEQIKNALYAQGVLGDDIDTLDQIYKARGMQLLQRLGYVHDTQSNPEIPILTRAFLGKQEDVTKPLIDDQPLSEERRIRSYTDEGENYIEWLLRYATEDHGRIRREEGFTDGKRPATILYDMLRHALNLEFGNASIRMHENAAILSVPEAEATRLDAPFIGVQVGNQVAESRWDLIYRQEPLIVQQGLVVDHIMSLLRSGIAEDSTARLKEVLAALEILKDSPTARLERCLVEHLDCCHYRLDAWLLSLLHTQLQFMRLGGQQSGAVNRGVYLGAFGWVEDLKSDNREFSPAPLDDVQRETFDPDNTGQIVIDSDNAGYLHAPSNAHALTAAVLRNAFISTASPAAADQYSVNLSSERIRMALSIIEGMQQGQGLAELLGYRLERGLHDNNEEELDIFIYELRKVFPLVSNRLRRTAIRAGRIANTALEAIRFAEEDTEFQDDKAVTKIEARNVVNGLALLDHIKESGQSSYPFGFPTGTGVGHLRQATDGERDAIDAEVLRLMNIRDAIADLALAESVHQVVQGNYDRAAGALDAYSKGAFPQIPDVIQSPVSGKTVTHRFGIHLPSGVSPATGVTPRAKAEPALAAWLRDLVPGADSIACTLRFRAPVLEGEPPNPWTNVRITLQDLGLEPIDLLYLHDADSAKTLSALDDHVLRVFRSAAPRRPDLEIAVDYTAAGVDDVTFFELGSLLSELRTLVLAARPLEASDIALQNEGSKTQNVSAEVAPNRITAAKAVYDAALSDLHGDIIAIFDPLVDFEDVTVGLSNIAAIVAAIDARSDLFAEHMSTLSLFGMTGAGAGYVHDRKRSIHAAFRNRVVAFLERWENFETRYQTLIDIDLPAATAEHEQIAVLQRAEALISTSFTTTFTDVADLQSIVEGKKDLFDAKRDELRAFLPASFLTLAAQHAAAVNLTAGIEAFDQEPLTFDQDVRLFVALAEDMLKQARQLHARGTQNSGEVQTLLNGAVNATPAEKLDAMKQAGVLLFGEGFKLLPEFRLSADRALELQNCLDDLTQLLQHQHTTLERDFPVDDWLYGVARVREKLTAWENLVMLAEGFRDRPSMELTPFQLPYRENDSWLAVEYPESHVIEGDTMLYTAYAPGIDPAGAIVGLLVDEWTETLPAGQETTALTFHYDRPNCEAPQSLLLVTPSTLKGTWSWAEVVGSLHEALDLARLRAVEPDLLDELDYARFLPATVATLTFRPVTFAINYAAMAVATVPNG